MTPQLDKIRDRQVIGPTYIWHTAYVKKVTHDEIWKTTKFNLLNKIFQLQLKKKNSLVDKFWKEINIPIEVKRESIINKYYWQIFLMNKRSR